MNKLATPTPYRDKEELLVVRHHFYEDPNDLVSSRAAVASVRHWQTRGQLPHAVDATAWIVSAVLDDINVFSTSTKEPTSEAINVHNGSLSNFSEYVLRNSYSMALVRFVNGILDPFQQGTFAAALSVLAKDIGLPYSFVEIRHWCTHEHLPSLEILRVASQKALHWLYVNFWVSLDQRSDTRYSIENRNSNSTKSEVVSALREYRNCTKRRSGEPNQEDTNDLEKQAIQRLKSIAIDSRRAFHLVRLLVSKKALLKDIPVASIHAAYDCLLRELHPSFIVRLILALLSESKPGSTVNLQKKPRDLDVINDWILFLNLLVTQGSFPFELHRLVYSCKLDIELSIENYRLLLCHPTKTIHSSETAIVNRDGKNPFTKAPSLEEIFNASVPKILPKQIDTGENGEQSDEARKTDKETVLTFDKRRKTAPIFEKVLSWDPVPFGISPSRRQSTQNKYSGRK